MKWLILCLGTIVSAVQTVNAEEICNICLYTPHQTDTLITGKGGSLIGQKENERVEKLDKPLFKGELFYSLDGADKIPLPKDKGVFFTLSDKKKHSLKILGAKGKNWGKVSFDCAEYEHGTKIVFESYGSYGPGWKTNPLPKDPKKCPWHPEKEN